ncbi:MAG: Sua5/YciO/YrdC/YwlC family protein [Proteobacteria bacterium]|nr:Sua5/YciO/YrdC/YwlC family protein [Pseudomonadota bacterium]
MHYRNSQGQFFAYGFSFVIDKRKTIGIRVPNHEVIRSVVRSLGRPVISTTAQRPGAEPHVDPSEIDDDFPGLGLDQRLRRRQPRAAEPEDGNGKTGEGEHGDHGPSLTAASGWRGRPGLRWWR